MTDYYEGNWVEVKNIGELRKTLQTFPDGMECNVEVRFLEVIHTEEDGRSTNLIQFRASDINEW